VFIRSRHLCRVFAILFSGVRLCGSSLDKRIDVSEERITSIIRAKRIVELGTTLAVTNMLLSHVAFLRSVLRLLVTANVVASSPILSL
jgi:hypothetical protein